MSLWGGFDQYAPDTEAYARREKIPAKDRCKHCDGLGSVRYRFSGCFGENDNPRGSKDWMECYNCGGSGRKPDEE